MTPRGTDWSLAALVALLGATGALVVWAGSPGRGWVFAAHDVGGFALGGVLVWKLRRVLPLRRASAPSLGALGFVLLALLAGWLWSTAGPVALAGFSLLAWHTALGAVLVVVVLVHALGRAKRLRRRDLAGRRQFLAWGGTAVGAVVAWRVQALLRPDRRFTGSYEQASGEGNAFPTTSWVADTPRELGAEHRVRVTGLVSSPLSLRAADLDAGDELEAVLDCTGGFWSRQRWRGVRLDALVARAGVRDGADHVRIVSHTGYRWSFALHDADRLLLATHVSGEALSHGHGAPVRLVAPGRRGFQWVKWVERVELHAGPDPGAGPATVWSSFTAAGRGAA